LDVFKIENHVMSGVGVGNSIVLFGYWNLLVLVLLWVLDFDNIYWNLLLLVLIKVVGIIVVILLKLLFLLLTIINDLLIFLLLVLKVVLLKIVRIFALLFQHIWDNSILRNKFKLLILNRIHVTPIKMNKVIFKTNLFYYG